jgi:hypothetical protein
MLVVDVEFENVQRTESITGGMALIPANPAAPAFITFTFPPQAVLEQARLQGGPPVANFDARLSGPTRLSFRFPAGGKIPFTAAGLLGWTGLVNAPDRSAVECVWDLILRPADSEASWVHSEMPLTTPDGVIELWRTRLTRPSRRPVPVGDVRTERRQVPFASSLTPDARSGISAAAAVRPLLAHDLTLTPLGATVDLAGNWEDLAGLTVASYRHRAVIGRDVSVDVVSRGFLFPFGFPARLERHTERRLAPGDTEAVLELRLVLTVTAPEIHYEEAVGVPVGGRDVPFRRLRVDGPLVSEVSDLGDPLGSDVSWVNAPNGARLIFNFTAEDANHHTVSFSAPVGFVLQDAGFGRLHQAVLAYDQQRQQVPAPATGRISLLPADDASDTGFDVTALYIGARVADATFAQLRAAGQLAAFPRLVGIDARVPELEAFDRAVRSRNAAGVATTLHLDPKYVEQGLSRSGIYASLKNPVAFAPPATSVGGVASLGMSVVGMSVTTGLVGGDLEAFRSGQFDPAKFLAPSPGLPLPTLLGIVKLADLVHTASVGEGETAPRVMTEVVRSASGAPTVRSTMTWRPRVKTDLFEKTLRTTLDTTLDLRSTTTFDLAGGEPTSHVEGELRAFALEFANQALIVRFSRLAFVSRPGTSPTLDLKVADVEFGGDLRFLNALRQFLPSPATGPRVAVTAGAIEAGYTLAVPTLSTGMFLLQNLAISATVTLPLDGRPVRARFAVSSRDDPFLVTVSLLGGGGFIALEVEGTSIKALEAQLEFGAAAALNLGVASAAVAITAGIYIRLTENTVELRGFFRAVGELDVLGVVNISVELYLSLAYRDGPGGPEAHAFASFTIRVRVMFFSESVSFELERSFSLGAEDPTFDQTFPTVDPWRQRCAAFASMEAP